MPELYKYKATKEQVDNIDMVRNSSKVLVRIEERNEEKKTKSGIWMVSPTDMDWDKARHYDRYGIVHRVPPNLRYDNTPFSMSWKTNIQIREGDQVWFDYMNSANCIAYECDDGNEYKILDYENLYILRRGDEEIPLNGYCMFSDYVVKTGSKLDITDGKVDPRYGIVEYVSSLLFFTA